MVNENVTSFQSTYLEKFKVFEIKVLEVLEVFFNILVKITRCVQQVHSLQL